MTVRCVIPDCKSSQKDKAFFKFPAEDKELVKKWFDSLSFLNLNEKKIDKYFLCEDHFFQHHIIEEDTDLDKKLTKDAVPIILSESTNQDSHNENCRFCMIEIKSEKKVEIDDQIRLLFEDVTNTEFQVIPEYSNIACKGCCSELHQCSSIKKKFLENQEKLFDFLAQQTVMIEVIKQEDHTYADDTEDFELSDYISIVKEENREDTTMDTENDYTPDSSFIREYVDIKEEDISGVPFECDICGKKTQLKGRMQKHMKCHLRSPKYHCDACDIGFKLKREMIKHQHELHPQGFKLFCHMCAKSFNYSKHFENHMIKHSGQKPFQCDEPNCGKAFHARELLANHKNKVHREPTICEICSKLTKDIVNHMKRHVGYRFECSFIMDNGKPCGKRFITNSRLRLHMDIHAGIRKYVCKYCSMTYKRSSALNNHVRTNHLHFKIKCIVPGCDLQFVRKENLRCHVMSAHKSLSHAELQDVLARIRETPLPKIDHSGEASKHNY